MAILARVLPDFGQYSDIFAMIWVENEKDHEIWGANMRLCGSAYLIQPSGARTGCQIGCQIDKGCLTEEDKGGRCVHERMR